MEVPYLLQTLSACQQGLHGRLPVLRRALKPTNRDEAGKKAGRRGMPEGCPARNQVRQAGCPHNGRMPILPRRQIVAAMVAQIGRRKDTVA